MALIFYGLIAARETQRLRTEAEAEAAWREWRVAATEQASPNGPVQRKIPKSPLPPIRVLLLNHFKTMMAAAFIFGSILYGIVCFFARGIFVGGKQPLLTGSRRSDRPRPDDAPD